MESRDEKRRFPVPWRVERTSDELYVVKDANGFKLASLYCRDDLHKANWSYAHQYLTSDEARRIASAIARIPEFLMQRKGFLSRGGGHPRWKEIKPYHVALEDSYVRRHWSEIDATCRLNGIPFDATGERIARDGLWCIYEFANQLDAMMFWNEFEGRWLRLQNFVYPEKSAEMPRMKRIKDWEKFHGKWAR
jgi:hypothetical protein